MIYLTRKNGNTGEIKLVITELDRAEFVINGYRWINLNDTINAFNQDPNITNLVLTGVYAGDIKDSKLMEYIHSSVNTEVDKSDCNDNSNKEKVLVTGSEEKNSSKQTLESFLKDYDLTCKKCGDANRALIDSKGNIHECESCIKIDAYLKGKKEGYQRGWDDCCKTFCLPPPSETKKD